MRKSTGTCLILFSLEVCVQFLIKPMISCKEGEDSNPLTILSTIGSVVQGPFASQVFNQLFECFSSAQKKAHRRPFLGFLEQLSVSCLALWGEGVEKSQRGNLKATIFDGNIDGFLGHTNFMHTKSKNAIPGGLMPDSEPPHKGQTKHNFQTAN